MRNGVEVIVATDRNVKPLEPEYLRFLSSTVTRPITLAPHTLTNLMSMVLPTDHIAEEQNHLMSFLEPKFVTRTHYTTFNYLTTAVKNSTKAVTNTQTTITNYKTELNSKFEEKIQPTSTRSVVLETSPTLETEVFHTAYTYLNTFLDGDQPLVMSSTHTLTNTLVGTYDTSEELEPSEVFPTTNTYLKTIEFTKTLTDGTDYQIISTKDIVTQVVVTDKPDKRASNIPITTDVTKTYFVTYTYFSTYLDGDQTKVKSDVSVSSDVTIEKFFIKPKKTESKIKKTESPVKVSSEEFPFNIIATKTYLTTFTYFTTLLEGPNSEQAETKINSRTKVKQNVVTETIPFENLNTNYLLQLNSSLHRITGSLVGTAVLNNGDTVLITACRNSMLSSSYEKYEIKSTETIFNSKMNTDLNEIDKTVQTKTKQSFSKLNLGQSKTKTTFLHKEKIKPTKTIVNEATAEALIAIPSETSSYFVETPTVTLTPVLPSQKIKRTESMTIAPTSTHASQQSTTLEEELNVVKQDPGESIESSESDPPKKKQTIKQPNNQVNVSNLLNFNTLGINGMNVLGPVFNAMAELINNNLNTKADVMSRRNDTAVVKESNEAAKKPITTNVNPLLSFVNKFAPATTKGVSEAKVKTTTPRTPVYIPVGSFAQDSDFEESQDSHLVIANRPDNWLEKWKDTHAKNFEKGRPHDTPITILEGGIPISPGQVITTNSDVIIGRPGESGPRPPTFAIKNNVPIDMKPPPLPQTVVLQEDEDQFLGQHSTNQGIDFEYSKEEYNAIPPRSPLPLPPPRKHPQGNSHKIIRPFPGSHKNAHFNKHTRLEYDSGTMDLNPPPVPPPPPIRTHDVHRPITINHEQDNDSEAHKTSILSIPVHLGPNQNVENYISPADLNPGLVALPTLPVLGQAIISEPTPSIDVANPNGILLVPSITHIPLNLPATTNPNFADRSTGHQLLVNIQPSQVANIVIPHGSSTALIVSGGKQHSLKGEVIDDPSPHPEPETVGFVGAEPVLKIESDDIPVGLQNDVLSETGDLTKQGSQDTRVLFSNRPQLTTELIKIRPKPTPGEVGVHSQQESAQNQITLPHQSSGSIYQIAENHRQTENNFQIGNGEIHTHHIQNHRVEGQNTISGIYSNQNYHNHAPETVKGAANQNYRNEGQNFNIGLSLYSDPVSQSIPAEVLLAQNQKQIHNYLVGTGGLYVDQSKFIQGSTSVKGANGIYVDISPPGHLPPRPDINHHESHKSTKHQLVNENLSNHQSGVVHDVPLNAQVQLGSSQNKENLLKEILMSSNTNKHDSIYDKKETSSDPKFSESQNHIKRPVVDLPDNLSPPPLPKIPPKRPFVSQHSTSPAQRYPHIPSPTIPQPADFMVPPPHIPHRPNHKPPSDSRPVIPIGAGAPQQNYPNPRPEDIVIVPHKNRPGNYNSNIKHETHKPIPNVYQDLDIGGASDPLKTEYGEEIQESISRPLLPGQLPNELWVNKTRPSNHKDTDAAQVKPNLNTSSKPDINLGWNQSTKQTDVFRNISTHHKQTSQIRPSGPTKPTLAIDISGRPSFKPAKRPSGFVSNIEQSTNHKPSFTNHKEGSLDNHKDSTNLENHKEASFESIKTSSNRGSIKYGSSKPGLTKTPSGFVVNNKGNDIRTHIVPSVSPSGFIRNENENGASSDTELNTEESNQGSSVYTATNKLKNVASKGSGFVLPNRPADITRFESKEKPESGNVKTSEHTENQLTGLKVPSGFIQRPGSTTRPNKPPVKVGSTNTHTPKPVASSTGLSQKLNEPTGGDDTKGPNSSTIKFDSNKISVGYPSLTNSESHGGDSQTPTRYATDTGEKQNLGGTKRPAGFIAPVTKGPSKSQTDFSTADRTQYTNTKTKESPVRISGNEVIQATSVVKVPSGFTTKNETSLSYGTITNHNYGNKTVHFYEPKPSFDANEERDGAYYNTESEVDKWFASNFGHTDKNTKPTKFPPGVPQRNATSVPNTVLTTGSDIRLPLLPPAKIADVKPEEVMGLSPPPLERPRRPQRPQRPKPPYKYEVPTTPIAIENDFPPVRSPEFNRKPLKPQDIFPPRLPDNFVHHIPEFPVRNVPKPRPPDKPVTSLPIDVPGTSTTDNIPNVHHVDLEKSGGSDPYFAGSEINGHSKPILGNDSVLSSMRPPPLPALQPPPPPTTITAEPKPSTMHQEMSKIKTAERPKVTSSQIKQKVNASGREEISPTSTLNLPKATYHTKVSASVTPTVTQHYNEWQSGDIITGSETLFDPDQFSHQVTPTIKDVSSKRNIVTTLISTGSTTIFGDIYTPGSSRLRETSSKPGIKEIDSVLFETPVVTPTKTIASVHTTTLTVTTTMTTVVHSIGQKPFTKTIVMTKTLLSTVFNKVTETKTLVKPTTATIIQTHTVATTKTALVVPTALYPTQTKYPTGGTMKPEIFMADPHAKDTMTISVSSSMNNKNGDEKRKPLGTRLDTSNKDSIIVVMSNKHPGISEGGNIDVVGDDENDINDSRVVVGGVFDANDEKQYKDVHKDIECSPGCKAKRNELCQRIEGVMKCICRPGFARMFPDRPCRPTYTYNVKLKLEKLGSEQITYEKNSAESASPNMAKLASATKEGLDRMIMQSDLRDVYHGVMVNGFQGKDKKTMVDFYVQLSENTDESKLMDIFKKTLQTSNYSLGGTELFAAREADNLNAEDFNECLNPKFHDCSENARCFNLKGTYTCSCKEGFTDLSENALFPGRVCSDMIGCEYCGYHGACYSKGEGHITCECFQWYSGERCHINLKVLLIALVTIGAILLALLLVCAVLTCLNRRSRSSSTSRTNGSSAGYLRYRGPSNRSLDRRAMIGDSSSESSVDNLPYICPPPLPTSGTMSPKKPALRHMKGPAPRPVPPAGMEQRDRSVTVMIPRAKYRPMPPLSPHLTMSTFSPDKHLHKTAAQIATEQKLINYLDGNTREERSVSTNQKAKEQQKSDYKSSSTNVKESPRPAEKKKESRVFEYEYKISNMLFTEETNSTDKRSAKSGDDRFRRHSDSTHINSDNSHNKNLHFRKYSAGALVSAGYEVSAKVGMHHLEDDTTEDEQSGIINTHTMKSSRSQFTTLNRTGDHKTMSEARSYDETTVHPTTRSLKTHYSGSSPSSRVNNDEGHTMIERDLGSTFIMPESQLFKPEADRDLNQLSNE